MALSLMVISAHAQLPSYVPSSGLVGYWPFTGNTNDASTAGNNLTNSGATLTTDRFGNSNEAYNFNGSSQSMTKTSPSFTFGPTSSFTVSFWMYKPTLSYGVALMNSSGANGNFIWNVQTGATGNFQFGTNKQGSTWAWAQSSYAINQWYHVVATYNNGAMTLYLNGTSVATQTFTQTTAATTNLPLYVGKGHSGNYFTGKVDDLGIWNRVLTQAEITLLYTGCDIAISTQPADEHVVSGAAVDFMVATSDTGATRQWQHDLGSGFVDITNGGQYSGATTDTLTVSNTTLANNNEMFRCVFVKGTGCTDTSDVASLEVCGELVGQPTNQSVNAGSMVKFGTSSSDPAATFQWQLNAGTGYVSLTNGTQFIGPNTDTLTIASATMSLSGKSFRCLSTSGTCSDTSDEAILTVVAFGIDELSDNNPVIVYPNPAQNNLVFQVNALVRNKPFLILNNVGQVVLSGIIEAEKNSINISELANGYYVIRIGDGVLVPFSVVK